MAMRNALKAFLALFLLLALALLPALVFSPQASRAGNPDGLATAAQKDIEASPAPIPLELRAKIDPAILKELAQPSGDTVHLQGSGRRANYIVHLKLKADLAPLGKLTSISQKRRAVVDSLILTAQQSQASLLAYLESQKQSGHVAAYTPFWIFNGVAVSGDLETLLALAARPEVENIKEDRVHHLPAFNPELSESAATAGVEWNISMIGADRAWEAFGIRGQGVVVASLDSGADWTHPALQRKYRGYDSANPSMSRHDYNWFDFTDTYTSAPDDGEGHGTHVMGTMVGSLANGQHQVSVAPEAQWVAVKVFDDNGDSSDALIHAGFQWIIAPTDLAGQNPNPDLAPDVCSNSWGVSDPGRSSDITFWDDVVALRAAGVFPVFAIGNAENGSLEPAAPGTYPQSFGVGATDSNDEIASFSCLGPSPWNEIKPEIVAPGMDIRSTLPENEYGSSSGTSMATPHVAGVVALVLGAQRSLGTASLQAPPLTITATEQAITSTARPLPDAASIPNNTYGWGRVDAYQAVGSVIQAGTLRGRVTDASTGLGVSAVNITMVNQRFGGWAQAWTDSQGYYEFSVAAGVYAVTATHFYYAAQTISELEVIAHTVTQLDLHLLALPAGTVLGRVLETGTGQPVAGTVRDERHLVATPIDVMGHFTLTLPVGNYTLEAVPARTGHKIGRATVSISSDGQIVHQDFHLEAGSRILLVNADAWDAVSEGEYYRSCLEALSHVFDTWAITRTNAGGYDVPPASTLLEYDLVVWSQPNFSPGYVDAWPSLSEYLQAGKKLFISGQGIGYWDVYMGYGGIEYRSYLHARYVRDDSGLDEVAGVDGTFMEDVHLTLNAVDSAGNQESPSEIAPQDALASMILEYGEDGGAALAVDDCQSQYRVVYLPFGLGGAGPSSARTEALRRSIEWLVESEHEHGASLTIASRHVTGAPGNQARLSFTIGNMQQAPDTYLVMLEGNQWPATIWGSASSGPVTSSVFLSPCSFADLTMRVQIPDTAITGQSDGFTLRIASTTRPTMTRSCAITVTAAMPWRSLSPLLEPRYRLAAAPVDDCRLAVIGGWDPGDEASAATEIYDLRTNTWRTMAPKPGAVANTAAAAIGGRIYVPGGMQGDSFLSMLEIYEPWTNRWTRGADLPRPMGGMGVSASGGKLYLFGGTVGGGTTIDSTWEYDPATQLWRARAALPSGPRAYAAAAELDGKIYLAGGWPALRTFECYDPSTDSWTSLAPMPTGRQSLGLVALADYVYAIGGGDGWVGLSVVERYDPKDNTWVTLSPLRYMRRAGVVAVATGGHVFALGGTGRATVEDAHETLTLGTSLADSGLTLDRWTAPSGTTLAFTITLRNPGSQSIAAASFYNYVPTYTRYVSGSLGGGASYDPSANRVAWRGAMAARSSKSFFYRVEVAQGLERHTIITNTAVISDGRCGEHTVSATATVEAPDLSQSFKSVDKSVAKTSDTLSYHIELLNVGAVAAPNLSVLDPLPAQTSYISGSVQGATYNAGLNRIEWLGELPAGAVEGYRWADSDTGDVMYGWLDASDGGATVSGGDDVCRGPYGIGFPFVFYGVEYSDFYMSSNGLLLFGEGSSRYQNTSIPSLGAPDGFIAAFWDDLVSETGSMHYRLVGDAPNRKLVAEWADVHPFESTSLLTFEVVLFEGSNHVLIQYKAVSGGTSDSGDATVGVESQNGTRGVQYVFGDSGPGYPLHAGLAVLFEPSVGHSIRYQVRVAPDSPPNALITNEASLSMDGQPLGPLTATTLIQPVDMSASRKWVDKPVARSGDILSYHVDLHNSSTFTVAGVSLVDALPAYTEYISDSVRGGVYNPTLNQIEWNGTLGEGTGASYRWTDSDAGGVAYDWIDATQGGVSVPGGDDQSYGPFELGFPFQFYRTEYAQFYISTNGLVLFGQGSTRYANAPIPQSDEPSNFIAPFWDDLITEAGTIYYRLMGSAPQRFLVIEWKDARLLSTRTPLSFEVILYEGSNDIRVQYHVSNGPGTDGGSASVGIENATGTGGVEYLYNGSGPGYPLRAGKAVLFSKGGYHSISYQAQLSTDVPLNTPIRNQAVLHVDGLNPIPLTATVWVNQVDLAQSSISVDKAEAQIGETLTYGLVLRNSGNVAAPNASVSDPIPVGLDYVTGSALGGASYNEQENRIEWRGAVGAGASVPITFTAQVRDVVQDHTLVTNTASFDDGLGNVVTRTVVTVLRTYDLSASEKVMPPLANPDAMITCTIHLRNTGAASVTALMTDVLPSAMSLVPGSLWWSDGQGGEDAGVVTWSGSIVGEGLVVVRFQAHVDASLAPGAVITNTVLIQGARGEIYERTAWTRVQRPVLYLPLIRRTSTQ